MGNSEQRDGSGENIQPPGFGGESQNKADEIHTKSSLGREIKTGVSNEVKTKK